MLIFQDVREHNNNSCPQGRDQVRHLRRSPLVDVHSAQCVFMGLLFRPGFDPTYHSVPVSPTSKKDQWGRQKCKDRPSFG